MAITSKTLLKGKMGIILLTVLVVVGSLLAIVHRAGHQGVCSDRLIRTAAMDFGPGRIAQLDGDVKKVTSHPNYTSDPNCLYIVMQHALLTSNSGVASRTYLQLVAVYNSEKGFSKEFGPHRLTMRDFQENTRILKQQAADFQKNFYGVDQP